MPSPSRSSLSVMPPWVVNFRALWVRLNRICCTRSASPRTARGASDATSTSIVRFFCAASPASALAISRRIVAGSNGALLSSSRPASMRATSSASLTWRSSSAPERRIASAYWCWRSLSWVFSSNSVMPSTPVSGVRISCAMLARKRDFAVLACSAMCWRSSLSARRCCCCRRRRSAHTAHASSAMIAIRYSAHAQGVFQGAAATRSESTPSGALHGPSPVRPLTSRR